MDALERRRPAVVFADHDVDGASSAAQLVRWFRTLGQELPIYVPDRILEGYGPSPAAFRRLKAEGAELVITVDCGAAAHDALTCAAEIGLEVVVIDHHLMRGEEIPATSRPQNLNRPDCASGQGVLAAAGVTFVLLAALNREARRRGLFGERAEPDPRQWLDLAAMGAICDVTDARAVSIRALAAQGLKVMSAWRNPEPRRPCSTSPSSQGPGFGLPRGLRAGAEDQRRRADLDARTWARGCSPPTTPRRRGRSPSELDILNASRKEVERGGHSTPRSPTSRPRART